MKLPISAMVVGFNEAHYLRQCLESISFCEEIVYTDLGSNDNSVSVAELFTDIIYHRNKTDFPFVELVQAEIVSTLKNDWLIFIDPDERIDPSLSIQLQQTFEQIQYSEKIGAVVVPWEFYFNKRKLKGTVWGNNKKYLLVNKWKFDFLPVAHYGRKLKNGYSIVEINRSSNNVLHHYWMSDYRSFIKKHQRYLKREGLDQYNSGKRINKKEVFSSPLKEFRRSFIGCKGYKDDVTGFLLSLFWAYYKTYSAIDLLLIQRKYRLRQ